MGIRLEPSDPLVFGPEIVEEVKRILPFSQATFFPCDQDRGLESILDTIAMSQRQRERAWKRLSSNTGFWDRLALRALVPLSSQEGLPCLGLYEFTGVPKDISTAEADRILLFLQAVLKDRLFFAKLSACVSTDDQPPPFVSRMLHDRQSRPLRLIQMSCHKKAPPLDSGRKMLERYFPSSCLRFAGRSCSSLWFRIKGNNNNLSEGIRQLALHLSRSGMAFRALLGHEIHKDCKEIYHWQYVARGLNSAVFMPSAAREILLKTGADLKSPAFSPGGFSAMPGACCAMISLESMAAKKRLEDFFEKRWRPEIQIIEAGTKCLSVVFPRSVIQDEPDGLAGWGARLFQDILRHVGSALYAGFARASEAGVSKKFLHFHALYSLIHAQLLGPGNMAVFDHVTRNVQGDLLVSWGDIRGACSAYKKGLKLNPSEPNLLNSLGVVLADLKRTKQAKACFEQVLSDMPDNFMAIYNLAGINLDAGQIDAAEKQTRKAYSMAPQNPAVLLRLAKCWEKQGRFQELLNLLLPEGPQKGNLQLPLPLLRICGRAALETGTWQEARQILTLCLHNRANDPLCLALLAKGYHMRREMARGSRLWEACEDSEYNRTYARAILTDGFLNCLIMYCESMPCLI